MNVRLNSSIFLCFRFDKKDDSHNPQEDARTNDYDGFTETPTESQVRVFHLLLFD